jgi:fucose permease
MITDKQRGLLFILLFGTMLMFGLIENIKGVSYPLIQTEFGATWEQQGFLVSMLSVGYVCFSVVAGLFLVRFGIKPSYMFGFSALAIGLVAIFFSASFFWIGAGLFVVFAAFGFLEIGVNALAAKLFTKKPALLMNMLHSLYGVGAIFAPLFAGSISSNEHLGWRYVYLFSLPVALLLFVPSIIARFPKTTHQPSATDSNTVENLATPLENLATTVDNLATPAKHMTFFSALKMPAVWLLAITLGLSVSIEMSSSNWGAMYFRDLYGFDPTTTGATFLSIFYLVFTLSRLVCGLFIEKLGYMRTLLGVSLIMMLIFFVGFFLGRNGIYVLPALGFFVALLWPTLMAVGVRCFGKDAAVCTSVTIAIAGLLNAGIQYIVGLTNTIGSAWGYRSTIVYNVLLIAALILLQRTLKHTAYRKQTT